MYSRFIAGCQNARIYYNGDIRGDKIGILDLLSDVERFNEAKAAKIDDYVILNDLLLKMHDLDTTRNGYHRFGHLVSVLAFLGIVPEDSYSGKDDDTVEFLLAISKSVLNFECDSTTDYCNTTSAGVDETLFLNGTSGMAESIVEGGMTPLEDCKVYDEGDEW